MYVYVHLYIIVEKLAKIVIYCGIFLCIIFVGLTLSRVLPDLPFISATSLPCTNAATSPTLLGRAWNFVVVALLSISSSYLFLPTV